MDVSCDPNDLMAEARCYDRCVPPGMHPAIQTYLLQQIAENTMTPEQLVSEAKCLSSCIPAGMMPYIIAMLMCEIVNNLES